MIDYFIEADVEHGRVWIEVPGTDLYLPATEALALGHAIETAALRVLGLAHLTHDGKGNDSG